MINYGHTEFKYKNDFTIEFKRPSTLPPPYSRPGGLLEIDFSSELW